MNLSSQVIQAIRSSINMVTETIGVLEISDPEPKQAATLTAKVFPEHQKTPPMKLSSRAPAVAMLHNAAGADAIMDQSPQDKLRDSMKGPGLAAGVKSLTQMADAVAPIVDNFNSVLVRLLDQYSQLKLTHENFRTNHFSISTTPHSTPFHWSACKGTKFGLSTLSRTLSEVKTEPKTYGLFSPAFLTVQSSVLGTKSSCFPTKAISVSLLEGQFG